MAAALSKERRRRSLGSALAVAVVLGASGFMLATSAQGHAQPGGHYTDDLAVLVDQRTQRTKELTSQAGRLSKEVEAMTKAAAADHGTAPINPSEALLTGAVPVAGPGITVTMSDAPTNHTYPDANANDLVVHQQDIQGVINALWAGGAEAMTLQGLRVTPRSAFRCAGSILLLHGRVFSPPYVIQAIGDPAKLRAGLDAEQSVQNYLSWVAQVGLGWKVVESSRISLPAYDRPTELKYARPLGAKS